MQDKDENFNDDGKNKSKWLELLSNTRQNYLRTIKVLSDVEKEFESTVINLNEKKIDYRDETVNLIKDWIFKGNKIQKEFQSVIQDGLSKMTELFPKNFTFPLKDRYEQVFKQIHNNFKKIFDSFPLSCFFNKRK